MDRHQLIYGLGRLAALARQKDWQVGEEAGLTPTQGDALRLLADRRDGLRLKDLAAQLSVRPSTASDAVSALVSKGLAERRPDRDERRAIRIFPSPSGRAMLGKLPDGFTDIVSLLSDQSAEDLHGIVLRTIRELQRMGRIAPQRLCMTCRYFVASEGLDRPTEHYCRLINAPLREPDLRINCPEHEEEISST
ncbi:MAG: winged helix-turn-helix transcriptional regulator [Phenylobacterium sp.]|jgi:DNA-binding MarR family transcriptional regulator|uniref:MarR family winged helix-turn-helix transcriptional regulator n=1 Tax=Phenylobacterium sp. TaxID=1871053 RepID=UPI0025E9BC41|nr:MarR family winged helix-turn-helix transcriptional regulator [Phenylobacterium sp.]MCA3698292.1 winged helix-turn-helix transcriptional regulator [Brevundimonas sp.]MCA6300261.1 winged helix-turn-helix transcriptional regulator [Phenylobacterium sp.]